MKKALSLFLLLNISVATSFAAPKCMDRKKPMTLSNQQVINFKEFTEPKFKARAFVKGVIVSVVEERQSHMHWEVDLDGDLNTSADRVEVVYNQRFGQVPSFKLGRSIIYVCGDYITDVHSPMGAVIHWVHYSTKVSSHEHGFIEIDGVLTGDQVY